METLGLGNIRNPNVGCLTSAGILYSSWKLMDLTAVYSAHPNALTSSSRGHELQPKTCTGYSVSASAVNAPLYPCDAFSLAALKNLPCASLASCCS